MENSTFEITDMMSFVFKLFLGNEAILTTLIGYILLAGLINLIKYIDSLLRGES